MVRHALQNFLTKLALGTLLTCGPHFAAKLLYSALRVYELEFFFPFPRDAKKLPSGGLVRSRPPLAQAARGSGLPCSSNIYQAVGTLSNCGHHFAAICGIPLSVLMDLNFIGPPPRLPTNSQAGGSFGLAPRLHRLRGAMVHHAPRNFPKTLRAVGTLLACGQHLTAIFRIPLSALLDSNFISPPPRPPTKIPKRGARSVSPPACTGCGGQWSTMLLEIFRKPYAPSALCLLAVNT